MHFTSAHRNSMKKLPVAAKAASQSIQKASSTFLGCKMAILESLKSPFILWKEIRQTNQTLCQDPTQSMILGGFEALPSARETLKADREYFIKHLPSKTGARTNLYRACYNIAATPAWFAHLPLGNLKGSFIKPEDIR